MTMTLYVSFVSQYATQTVGLQKMYHACALMSVIFSAIHFSQNGISKILPFVKLLIVMNLN